MDRAALEQVIINAEAVETRAAEACTASTLNLEAAREVARLNRKAPAPASEMLDAARLFTLHVAGLAHTLETRPVQAGIPKPDRPAGPLESATAAPNAVSQREPQPGTPQDTTGAAGPPSRKARPVNLPARGGQPGQPAGRSQPRSPAAVHIRATGSQGAT